MFMSEVFARSEEMQQLIELQALDYSASQTQHVFPVIKDDLICILFNTVCVR